MSVGGNYLRALLVCFRQVSSVKMVKRDSWFDGKRCN